MCLYISDFVGCDSIEELGCCNGCGSCGGDGGICVIFRCNCAFVSGNCGVVDCGRNSCWCGSFCDGCGYGGDSCCVAGSGVIVDFIIEYGFDGFNFTLDKLC